MSSCPSAVDGPSLWDVERMMPLSALPVGSWWVCSSRDTVLPPCHDPGHRPPCVGRQYRAHGGCATQEDGVGWCCGPAGVEAEGNAAARPTSLLSRPLSPSVTLFDRLGTADGPKGPGLSESEVAQLPIPARPRRWRGVGRELASGPKSWCQPVLGTLGSSRPSLGHASWRLVLEASTHFQADSLRGHWLPRVSQLQVVIEASFDCPPPPKRQAA